jgi:hypothetical protein
VGRRRPDPRVRTNATPQCTVTIGKSGNAKLTLTCLMEQCSVKDCPNPPLVSKTVRHEGTIQRYCKEHIGAVTKDNARLANQAELEVLKRWALARMS